MLKKKYFSPIICITLTLFLFSFLACKKKKDNTTEPDEFDKGAMLKNIGNAIIIANYNSILEEVSDMDSLVEVFTANPEITNLSNLRSSFKEAYIAWQHTSTFDFGPAEDILLRANANTFPTDTTQINSNISSGTYDLTATSNLDAKAFPAIDYLLFGIAADSTAILDQYISDTYATNRKTYLKNVSEEIENSISQVYSDWISTGGNYINTFTSSTGNDVGGSLSLLVNEINYDFEIIKNYEIGIPLGKQTLGTPLPEKTQAYYAGISAQLAIEHLKAIENIYLGRAKNGTDGSGIDEYLIYLQASYNGGLLSDAIKTQFTETKTALEKISDPLSETILTNSQIVDDAYSELQQLLVLLKTDMPSAMGILITYQDNDGD